MESVYIPQNTMRIDELGDNEFNRASLSTDPREPELFEEKVPIHAALAATFDLEDPPNPPRRAPGMDPAKPSPSFELTIFKVIKMPRELLTSTHELSRRPEPAIPRWMHLQL